jgi:thermitase
MNNWFVFLLGPLLMILVFLYFGKGMVNRAKGKEFKTLYAFLFILFALSFPFIIPGSWVPNAIYPTHADGLNILDRLAYAFFSVGIGMVADSFYLASHKNHPKVFWVPGVLSLILAIGIWVFGMGMNLVSGVCSVKSKNSTIQLLVELGPDDKISELKSVLHRYKAEFERAFPEISISEDEDLAQFYLVYVDSSYRDPMMMELRNDPENVDFVEVNRPVNLDEPRPTKLKKGKNIGFLANDPYLKDQWFASGLDYDAVYRLLEKKKVKKKALVAIVDTGVDKNHEDISGVFRKDSPGNSDQHSHGTHCAGLAGAITNNGKGVGSLNWEGRFIEIAGFPALNKNGAGTDHSVSKAILDAAKAGADVISMSLGSYRLSPPRAQTKAIEFALSKGAIVVVAAGNSNMDAKNFSPANIKGVIVVSAVDSDWNKASFSNTNTSLNMPIAAPGVNIVSLIPDDKYASFNGTSMATPIVSGLVGIMRAIDPGLSATDAYKRLQETGKNIEASDRVGKLIQPAAAIAAGL